MHAAAVSVLLAVSLAGARVMTGSARSTPERRRRRLRLSASHPRRLRSQTHRRRQAGGRRRSASPASPGICVLRRPHRRGTARKVSASWRPGCPVPLEDLRLLPVTHVGFDGRPRAGELVVHVSVAEDIIGVFHALVDAGFPIEQVDSSTRSARTTTGPWPPTTRRRSTVARPRVRAGGPSTYGKAIDINPVQNPYVMRSGAVLPPSGSPFTERNQTPVG